MPTNITLSDEIYRRLEQLAVGFDTPERVIERLLDDAGNVSIGAAISKPSLSFVPDEITFKNELIKHKKAQIVLHMNNGARDVLHWNASRFQPRSNLRANLWSGTLRNWKEKGIVSAELSILPKGDRHAGDNTNLLVELSEELKWTFDEVARYFEEIEIIRSDDDLPYYRLVTFSEETPDSLKEIGGLNDLYERHLDIGSEYDPDDYHDH